MARRVHVRRQLLAGALFGVLWLAPHAALGDPAESTAELPNLSPRKPAHVTVGKEDGGLHRALRFSITTDNLGPYHFDLLGAPPKDASRTAAQECIRWSFRVCEERAEVGNFVFHAAHGHWHLEDYALYELRSLDASGAPNMSPTGLVRSGGKVSFCLLDYERGPGERARDDFLPFTSTGFYRSCNGVSQGISAGWGDTYDGSLPGQQILIDGVPDGTYAIVVTVDPVNRLLESTRSDNVAFRKIHLSNGGSSVTELD